MPPETTAPPRHIGNYDLLVKIAEGGMGAVYKARCQRTGDIVAIKIVPPDTARNVVLMKRFEQEFRAASLLDHPNIVKGIEYCGTVATPFLVMEFVDGDSLGIRVERDGPIGEDAAVRIIAQVCDGLHRAHKQGLIHRDVKPDNILVTSDGIAKLTDLGLVKDVEGELNLTKTGRGLGTPHFMAPEQFRDAKNADVRCDIYSLGATLYMMLTGVVPFAKTSPLDCWMKKIKNDFPTPRSLAPRLSERVDWAVRRAMSAEPAQRPASCREFIEDLTGQAWQGWDAGAVIASKPAVTKRLTVDSGSQAVAESPADLWYLIYKTPDGVPHKVKGTTDSIRQNVRAGTLGDPAVVLVCRTKSGQFVPLREAPELRDLVIAPAAVPTTRASAVTAAAQTERATLTGGRTNPNVPPPRRATDPAAGIATEVHAIAPAYAARTASDPQHARPKFDWIPWIMLAFAAAAATVGALLFTR